MQHYQKPIFILMMGGITVLLSTLLASLFLFVFKVSLVGFWELYIIPFISSASFLYFAKKKVQNMKLWECLASVALIAFFYVAALHAAERLYYVDAAINLPSGGEVSRYTLNALFTFSTPPGGLFIIVTVISFLTPAVVYTIAAAFCDIFRIFRTPSAKKEDVK